MTTIAPICHKEQYGTISKQSALRQAIDELKTPLVDIDTYANITGKDTEEAQESDLNDDGYVSFWEKASEIIARRLFSFEQPEVVPSMVLNAIYQQSGFANDETKYLEEHSMSTKRPIDFTI